MMTLAGHSAMIKVSGAAAAFTNENTVASPDDFKTYQIEDVEKRVWSRDATITVYEDGVPTTENYTLTRLAGIIVFDNEDETRGTVTVSGEYHPMSEVTEAYQWQFSGNTEILEFNKFENQGRIIEPGLQSASITLSQFDSGLATFYVLWDGRSPVAIQLYGGGIPFTCWGYISGDGHSAVFDGMVENELTFESDGELLRQSAITTTFIYPWFTTTTYE